MPRILVGRQTQSLKTATVTKWQLLLSGNECYYELVLCIIKTVCNIRVLINGSNSSVFPGLSDTVDLRTAASSEQRPPSLFSTRSLSGELHGTQAVEGDLCVASGV